MSIDDERPDDEAAPTRRRRLAPLVAIPIAVVMVLLVVLLATGEQTTIALLSMALEKRGCAARSYTGGQVHIRTDSTHNKARIQDIDGTAIRRDLIAGRVVVVAGFQGVDEQGNITTLGRGGSDTTAVALAAAMVTGEALRQLSNIRGEFPS